MLSQDWPTFEDVLRAYKACRFGKSASIHQTTFETHLGKNILALHQEISTGTYQPSPTVCFVVERPKPREIFAAHFRDRIVHHLVVSKLTNYWEPKFISSSFACRKQKGTHAALRHLQKCVRSLSHGGHSHVWALQLDLASFFVTIHRPTLHAILNQPLRHQKMIELVRTLYLHDARPTAIRKGDLSKFSLIDSQKSWFTQDKDSGLPIGNLTSQFGANVCLTALDHFIQRELKPPHYLRYMDDLMLLGTNPDELSKMTEPIDQWIRQNRFQKLNPTKTTLIRLDKGIRYLGYECRQVDSPSQPLQLFLEPKKKWGFVKNLRTWQGVEISARHKPHPLSHSILSNNKLDNKIASLNSQLGNLKHANCYRLRKKSLEKLIKQTAENPGLPEEMGGSHPTLKIKPGYTAVKQR